MGILKDKHEELEKRLIAALDPKLGIDDLSIVQSALTSILIQTCRIMGMSKEGMLDAIDYQWEFMAEIDSRRKGNQ